MNQTEEITEAPKDCDKSGSIWESGRVLFEYIRKQVLLNGATGKVAFDDNGDRIFAEYEIINVIEKKEHKAVGHYYYNVVSINFISSKLNDSSHSKPFEFKFVCFIRSKNVCASGWMKIIYCGQVEYEQNQKAS